jgi:hypothetical protein
VGEALVEDQLSEVAVGHHQDPPLVACDGQNLLVSEAVRVLAGDGRYVVAEPAQRGNEAKVGALVEQEPHRGGASEALSFGLGETSSPVTIAFA